MTYDRDVHDRLAERLLSALTTNPTLTTNLLASQLDARVGDVAFVLDEMLVAEDGSITHVGPGQGGGWVSEETRADLVKPGESLFVGYRWPDGSFNEHEAFDQDNPEHVAALPRTEA